MGKVAAASACVQPSASAPQATEPVHGAGLLPGTFVGVARSRLSIIGETGMSDHSATPQTQDFDVQELAAKHNISIEEAKQLIEKFGNDRGSVDAAAQDIKLGNAPSPEQTQG